jgi:Spy/CpxP family protein refolding chaperone
MQNKTMTRVIGGVGAAALIGLGMATSLPRLGAAQTPNQSPSPAGPMGGGRGPGGRGMGRGGPGGPMETIAGLDPRDLTDAQRAQIKAIRDRHAGDMKPVTDRVLNARQALAKAVLTGADLNGPAVEIGAAETELALQSALIETEILGTLTPEQKQKIQDRQNQMAARRAAMELRRQSGGGSGTGNGK